MREGDEQTMKAKVFRKMIQTMLLALAMSGMFSSAVMAEVKTVKKASFDKNEFTKKNAKKLDKKALVVKRGKKYTLKVPAYRFADGDKEVLGVLKFKAPKKGIYKFTFSGITVAEKYNKKYQVINAVFYAYSSTNKEYTLYEIATGKPFKTEGGDNYDNQLCLGTKECVRMMSKIEDEEDTDQSERYMTSRTAKIFLKRNQIIYITLESSYPCKCKLVIR